MLVQEISLKNALDKAYLEKQGVKYALVYMLNKVKIIKLNAMDKIDEDLLIEARFFNNDLEVHIFKYMKGLKAVLLKDDKNDECILEEQLLLGGKFGEKLTVKNYISYDSDGQAYISYSRPCDAVIGGGINE